jgi:RNA polymerase sigma-70 factor (ECF subfamily)
MSPAPSDPRVPQPAPDPAKDAEFEATALPLIAEVSRVARAIARDPADAEDLVQETYLRAYRYWHTFEKGTDCRRWLSQICRNAMADSRRRTVREVAAEPDELEAFAAADAHIAAVAAGVGDMYSRMDLGPAILDAMARLDPVFRDVAVLSDIEGLSYSEIAAQLDVPLGTVRSRLFRARRQLQEDLMAYALDAGFKVHGKQ